jgi:tRNA threonylcarbamoyladenosine biosynthesis protein TsaE
MHITSRSVAETEALATQVVAALLARTTIPGTATILALQGDLGAGKTTFTKALARTFGITEAVTSPTFVIQKIYDIEVPGIFKHLVHIDAYRLEGEEELSTIGWHDYATNPDNLVVIEWPEQVGLAVPERALWIHFEHVSENERRIDVDDRVAISYE